MIKEKIKAGIYYIPTTQKISIEFPYGCSCDCYCCDDPDNCTFCSTILQNFKECERDACGYNVKATKEEFIKFLEMC